MVQLIWNAENRLSEVRDSSGTTLATYSCDHLGRRIAKTSGGVTTYYVYDGWNPIAEYTGTTLSKAYTWGMDLIGSMQAAGGVGGLLAVTDGIASYYPTYDGNGNISEYLDSGGTTQAHYEYDAFGNETVKTGTKADDFAHRFSTKPQDTETSLYYYGYRYYDSVTGKWPSRDPIEEDGGPNLYAMVKNDPVNKFDLLGMVDLTFAYITRIETPKEKHRGFIFNGGIKTTQTVSVDPDKCEITFKNKSVGLTIRYDAAGAVKNTGKASGSTIKQSAKKDPDDPCICILEMEGNENNPLIPSPGITYEVKITFDTKAKKYEWEVEHDRFPSHKLTGHSGGSLHNFSHVTAGTNPDYLFPDFSNKTNSDNASY